MKVLLINGSPHKEGSTYTALHEMEQIFLKEGMETEIIHIGNQDIRGCIGCGSCYQNGHCVFDDAVNAIAPKFEACDGLVVGSPVYYASANATLIAFLDRLFYSTHFDKTIALLSHKTPDSTIDITVEFGEGAGMVPFDKIDKRAEALL